uniref:J domain-containing protein n=1 Tax=Kalanchoe fedtschenkoi TaxID=63787 RepID=A0A7N0RIK9_KALFE
MASWDCGGGGGGGGRKESDFYGVLGVKKECTEAQLRSAYKKLALRWHPDRCSAGSNAKSVEEAKKKFQDIQEAYSVLSDSSKRFLYDLGVYDKEDDDENIEGMSDFLSEMAAMMQQNKPNENGGDSFENLQDLFNEMFQADIAAFSSSTTHNSKQSGSATPTSCSFSFGSYSETSNANNKRSSNDLNFDPSFQNFCFEVGGGSSQLDDRSKRRNSRQTRQ